MNTTLKPWAAALVAAHLCVPAWAAGDAPELKSEADRVSYAIGYQVGGDMKKVHLDLNAAAVTRGIADAQKGTAALMDEEAMRTTLTNLKHRVDVQDRAAAPQIVGKAGAPDAKAPSAAAHAQRMAPQGTDESKAFLAENAKKAGVVTLPSGLQYEVLKSGNGRQPKSGDKVALTYRGSLINGTEFGRTAQNGKDGTRTFAIDALVPGLKEAVSHMKEGDEWRVYVPPQLGFDARTPLFRKVTVFDIRLASVSSD